MGKNIKYLVLGTLKIAFIWSFIGWEFNIAPKLDLRNIITGYESVYLPLQWKYNLLNNLIFIEYNLHKKIVTWKALLSTEDLTKEKWLLSRLERANESFTEKNPLEQEIWHHLDITFCI